MFIQEVHHKLLTYLLEVQHTRKLLGRLAFIILNIIISQPVNCLNDLKVTKGKDNKGTMLGSKDVLTIYSSLNTFISLALHVRNKK